MVDEREERLLLEMLREAERVVDAQFEGMREHDDKTESSLNLAAASLGGGLLLAGLLPGAGVVPWSLAVAAATLNIVALGLLVASYIGFRKEGGMALGPHPSWLSERAQDEDWKLTDHAASVLAGHARSVDANARKLDRVLSRRRAALAVLLGALALYAIQAAYIVGRASFA